MSRVIWSVTFFGSVLAFLASSTTHLIPAAYVGLVKDVASLAGFVSGYLANSPLKGRA